MKKIAIFGNAGGGKSTLAKHLAKTTDLPLYPIDSIQYQSGGRQISRDKYLKEHSRLLAKEMWIIDGFGCLESAWERFSIADTLIYIDLSFFTHFLWITKRMFKGLWVTPEGWPPNSPIFKSTLKSYRVLWLCHRYLTPRYRKYVTDAALTKTVYHLKSAQEIKMFLQNLEVENHENTVA